MSNLLKSKHILSVLLFAILFFVVFLFSLFQINPAIDSGREFWLSYRVLNGEVLYKDIFNIYGPLAYQINACVYAILGDSVNSLRIFGSFNASLIMFAVGFILCEFFENSRKHLIWCLLWLCPLITGVFYIGIFNFTVPYSFAMSYGLCFFFFSLLFFIKFVKSNNNSFLFFAAFFAGGSAVCKYEFMLCLLFFLIYISFALKNNKKIFLSAVLVTLIIPLISFGDLFLRGLSFNDLINTFKIQKTMTETDAIKYFYNNFTGAYFNLKIFGYCLLKTALLGILTILFYFADKFYGKDKVLFTVTIIFILSGIFYVGFGVFSLFAVIHMILFLFYVKKIFQNKPLFLLMSSIIILSLKTFFAVNYDVYGTYVLPFIVISLGVFIYTFDFGFDDDVKKRVKKTFVIILISLLLMSVFRTVSGVFSKINGGIVVEPIKNPKNIFEKIRKTVYTYPNIAKALNETKYFITENTSPDDIVVILPETQFLNFITKRPADNLYDSITPLYTETFGEENIISHFKKTRPDYFILNSRDTSDYGKRYLCEDYGQELCKFIKKDYEKIKEIRENNYKLQIYRRADKK